jgi:hypothetical protein
MPPKTNPEDKHTIVCTSVPRAVALEISRFLAFPIGSAEDPGAGRTDRSSLHPSLGCDIDYA